MTLDTAVAMAAVGAFLSVAFSVWMLLRQERRTALQIRKAGRAKGEMSPAA